jgi:hypothetical protein
MKFRNLIFIFILIQFQSVWAVDLKNMAFGDLKKGQANVEITEDDFDIINPRLPFKIKTNLVNKSIQWVRLDDILLSPRARIEILAETEARHLSLRYRGQSILLQDYNQNKSYTQFSIDLFQPDQVEVYHQGEKLGEIKILTKQKGRKRSHLIDYSCSKFQLQIAGLENEFLTVGCKEIIAGEFGSEKPMLQVYFALSDYKILDGSAPPYIVTLNNNATSTISVINDDGVIKEFKVKATIPQRYKRLKFALGLGPYSYISQNKTTETDEGWPMAYMLYGKLDINPSTSIKLFDAFITKKTTFNNSGLYLSNDIAKLLDNRVTVNTLLGFQGLYFKAEGNDSADNSMIFPQGIEVTYHHPFDLDNYQLVFGAFLSTASDLTYSNIWVRFGKRVFWELNYIDWGDANHYIRTYGLSVGFPLASFL